MLYEGIVYLVLLVLMLTWHGRSHAVRVFAAAMLLNWICVACCICYLAKDVFYFDTIDRYFLISRAVWRKLVFLPVDRETLIRGMNIGALGFYACGLQFAHTFTQTDGYVASKWARRLPLAFFLVQAVLYDPLIYRAVYGLCYPRLMTAAGFHAAEDAFHIVSTLGNVTLLLTGIVRMLRCAARRSSLRILRMQTIPVAIGYAALMLFNTPFILRLPRVLTRVSIVAGGFTTYNTLPLGKVEWVYIAAAILNTAAFLTIALITIWRIQVSRRFENDRLILSQRIDAANTTSKVFCHYIKNEVLALEAELEELAGALPEDNKTVKSMQERCGRLYVRLDEAHRSTREEELHLRAVPILTPVRAALSTLSAQLNGFEVRLPESDPKVMLDLGCFTLCMEDVLRNAIEACDGLDAERRRIEVDVGREPDYVTLTVRDHGAGISREQATRLFTPFYSTKPAKRNWGVGLSLVYRVVHAHGGDVSIENAPGEGAQVRILLPVIADAALREGWA